MKFRALDLQPQHGYAKAETYPFQICVRLSAEQGRWLRQASKDGIPAAEILRRAVDYYRNRTNT